MSIKQSTNTRRDNVFSRFSPALFTTRVLPARVPGLPHCIVCRFGLVSTLRRSNGSLVNRICCPVFSFVVRFENIKIFSNFVIKLIGCVKGMLHVLIILDIFSCKKKRSILNQQGIYHIYLNYQFLVQRN